MKYHCGLLDDRPDKSRTLNWIKRPVWGNLPPEIERELRIWLAMPGFSAGYHAHTLGRNVAYVSKHMGGYERWRDEVAENWLSATRDDLVKLSQLRPGIGHVPLICQLRAVQDLKSGATIKKIAGEYRVHPTTITNWSIRGPTPAGHIPSGFDLLIGPNSIAIGKQFF